MTPITLFQRTLAPTSSAICEIFNILNATKHSAVISFSGGLPPGSNFLPLRKWGAVRAADPKVNTLRLSFVTMPAEQIDAGISVLAERVAAKIATLPAAVAA